MRRLLGALILGVLAGAVGLAGGGRQAVGQEPPSSVPATPVTPAVVAAAIAEDGWYADPESVGDREQLDQVADRLANQGEPMGFALLATEPVGSSPAFAEQVLDAMTGTHIRTIVVLSDADVGVVSDRWSDQAIDDALDETIDDLRADPTDGLEALADALASEPAGFDDEDDDTDDSGSTTGMIALGVLALGGVALASRYWSESADGVDDGSGDDSSGWSSSRRRRSSFRSSSSRRRSSSSGSSRRSSSSSSRRGRGGRRL